MSNGKDQIKKLSENLEYQRPKKTITDLLQNREDIEKKLEGFTEIPSEFINKGEFVRYITYDKKRQKELFRTGGVVEYNGNDYVMLKGVNDLVFSVQKNVKDDYGEILHTTRFFKKLKSDDIFKQDVQKILDKSNELIKKQTKIIQSLQKEIAILKGL